MLQLQKMCLLLCRFYDTGQIELTSLGNFGRVSVAHNNDGAVLLYKNVTTEGEAAVHACCKLSL